MNPMMSSRTTGEDAAQGGASALVVVDVQNDFCEGGALGVDGGRDVARRIASWVSTSGSAYDAIIVSRDHHRADSDNGGHFASEPDFVDTWPVHCVAGTEGAALDEGMAAVLATTAEAGRVPVIEVRKGYGEPAYSALEGSVEDPGTGASEPLPQLLAREGFDRADVCGLALDYCVAATARDLRALVPSVRILADLTAPVHPERRTQTKNALRAEGIDVAPSVFANEEE